MAQMMNWLTYPRDDVLSARSDKSYRRREVAVVACPTSISFIVIIRYASFANNQHGHV